MTECKTSKLEKDLYYWKSEALRLEELRKFPKIDVIEIDNSDFVGVTLRCNNAIDIAECVPAYSIKEDEKERVKNFMFGKAFNKLAIQYLKQGYEYWGGERKL